MGISVHWCLSCPVARSIHPHSISHWWHCMAAAAGRPELVLVLWPHLNVHERFLSFSFIEDITGYFYFFKFLLIVLFVFFCLRGLEENIKTYDVLFTVSMSPPETHLCMFFLESWRIFSLFVGSEISWCHACEAVRFYTLGAFWSLSNWALMSFCTLEMSWMI